MDNEFRYFQDVYDDINAIFEDEAEVVHTERWQATDISKNPAAQMVEFLHYSFGVNIGGLPFITEALTNDVQPNLPWADDHFAERVCGEPLNPGVEWANWPWGNSANEHREPDGTFNHNYMERYWPKQANQKYIFTVGDDVVSNNRGIRHEYGDLNNLVELLANEPGTRQAYLPVWFPEDTGTTHDGRKPCTLGYHFIMRNGKLDITYYIRSCDYIRHFKDDIYLTLRLLFWVINKCKDINHGVWEHVKPGKFIMHITSLHMFINDYIKLFGRKP